MATLKEFEDILRQNGMVNALTLLEGLKKRDRESRSIAPARRVAGRKMTAELARTILDLHAGTGMTQQEIAFKLGVNQGRVNEVIKRGKWLNADPKAPEALSRDKAMQRLDQRARSRRETPQAPATAQVTVTASLPDLPSALRHPTVAPAISPAVVRPPMPFRDSAPLAATRQAAMRPSGPAKGAGKTRAQRGVVRVEPRIISAQLAFLDL